MAKGRMFFRFRLKHRPTGKIVTALSHDGKTVVRGAGFSEALRWKDCEAEIQATVYDNADNDFEYIDTSHRQK